MSTVRITLADEQQTRHSVVSEPKAFSLIGALSADPETLREYERAMHRFFAPAVADKICAEWTGAPPAVSQKDPVPNCSIDLPGRLITTSWDRFDRQWIAPYIDEGGPHEQFDYDLSEAWLVKKGGSSFENATLLNTRRRRRADTLDVRHVFYGTPMLEFLADRCFRKVSEQSLRISPDWREQRQQGVYCVSHPFYTAAREVHEAWLLSRPAEGTSGSVRGFMLKHCDHITTDLAQRASQWTVQNACPPGLSKSDAAFVRGGFGTHEVILYYDLVRELLFLGLERIAGAGARDADLTEWLRRRRDEWLDTPLSDRLGGLTPAEAIEQERLRQPLVGSDDLSAHDEDCPICRMSAHFEFGPAFIYLDSLHFDDEFVFSLQRREEDWEESRNSQQDWFQTGRASPSASPIPAADQSVWQRVYINDEALGQSASANLVAVGFLLAELVEDIRSHGGSEQLVQQLNRHFENLGAATQPDSHSLAQPLIARFGETMDDVADQLPVLVQKCHALQSRLAGLARCW